MKIQSVVLILLVMTLSCGVSAQTSFSNRYGLNLPSTLFSGLERVGDTLYIIGISGDTSNNFVDYHYSKNLTAAITIDGLIVHDNVITADINKDYETFLTL